MQFKVVDTMNECINSNTIYLILDSWDDWFTYSTLFIVRYVDAEGKRHKMGGVKIGQKGQGRSPKLPSEFKQLSDEFFSLGVSETYYEAIKDNFPEDEQREKVFTALNDIAYDLDLFEKVKQLDVVQTSLMRDFSSSVVKNQLHRMTKGGAWLTPYKFSYFPNGEIDVFHDSGTELSFEVEYEKMPPSNIHVLIGKNGVGKTTLLKDMINSLEENGKGKGKFKIWDGKSFVNIVYVSFSAFDTFLDIDDDIVQYAYIGLAKKDGMKNIDELAEDFVGSLFEISRGNRKKLWEETIDILESDNTFIDLDIRRWYKEGENKKKELPSKYSRESIGAYNKRIFQALRPVRVHP